ncbi:MAG TPA: adenosine deaminase, partial [Polyangiaceae bacterium]|nr:adenosine deaminase [Polyangiaceae bacterium]
ECCPSSNVQTQAVETLESHPLKLYFDLGLRVTINTDNRLITDTSVSKELYLTHTQMGLPFKDIKSIIVGSFKSAFRPFHEKQAALRRVTVEIERFDDDGRLRPDAPAPTSDPRSRPLQAKPVAPQAG